MRAYLYDDLPGDQRLPHNSGVPVSQEQLTRLGVLHWSIPVDSDGKWEQAVDGVATKRGYKNRDVINVTKEGLGDSYEAKLKMFFEEHMHEDEEIRFILSGSGYFDVRDQPTDRWIRVAMEAGDLLVLPTGIYHRFTLDEHNAIKAIRLFQDEPKWTPYNRDEGTDRNPYRLGYLHAIATRS